MKTSAQKRAQATYARKRYPISTAQGNKEDAAAFREMCRDQGITQLEALRLLISASEHGDLKCLFAFHKLC